MPTVTEKRATFRALHRSDSFIMPNAWDAGSAVRLSRLGFPAIASTSAGAAWAAGRNDGELGLEEVLNHLRTLVAATDLPVNADFENGFAHDPEAVMIHVGKAVDTGVAAVSLEDWSGTGLYDAALAVERVAAAHAAIDAIDPGVMLIGRSEHFRTPDGRVSDSIARAVAYANAGADCLFVPGLSDRGAIAELVAAVAPKPVSVMIAGPDAEIGVLAALGVRRFSLGASLAAAAWAAFDEAARALRNAMPGTKSPIAR